MARQDLITALKNALERGESLQQAKLSLISAGYSQQEVEEAARALQFPPILMPKLMPKPPEAAPKAELKAPEAKEAWKKEIPIKERKKVKIPLWLIILLLILLGAIGYIIFVLMRLRL